jgi:hypothetical protein
MVKAEDAFSANLEIQLFSLSILKHNRPAKILARSHVTCENHITGGLK